MSTIPSSSWGACIIVHETHFLNEPKEHISEWTLIVVLSTPTVVGAEHSPAKFVVERT